MGTNKPWNSKDTEQLIALVKAGYSGSIIAGKLGISRNSVIGKVHRLGMQLGNSRNGLNQNQAAKLRKPHAPRFNKRREIKVISKPIYQNAPIPPPHIEDVARIAFPELEPQHCRFGVGDPKDSGFGFCGLDRIPGSVYCSAHHQRTHTPAPVRQPSKLRATTPVMADA